MRDLCSLARRSAGDLEKLLGYYQSLPVAQGRSVVADLSEQERRKMQGDLGRLADLCDEASSVLEALALLERRRKECAMRR